ncbi:MAG: TIGR02099 family protein [Rhodocyclaceae bacterium]|nr:TIGR02099 family protein [Rhodocyclaceae bacterium]
MKGGFYLPHPNRVPIPSPILLLRSLPLRFPWIRRLGRVLAWSLLGLYFGFCLLFLTLRYAVLPQIENYRGDLEREISKSLNLSVSISQVVADWQGLRPRLALHGISIRDAEGRQALRLENVEVVLAWSSLAVMEPRLHRLEIVAPQLLVRRDAAGKLFVAGLELASDSQDSGFGDWLLDQDRIIVRDASIAWHDEMRKAPPLALTRVNFRLDNGFRGHRFGITAEPPKALAARLDIRGDFRGRDLDALKSWTGQAYAELDYADLAVWRTWVDYPVDLPQGRGGLRLWVDFAAKTLTGVTADLALADVKLRLRRDLPMLDLETLTGRLSGRLADGSGEASAKRLTLATRDGVKVLPTDFKLHWEVDRGNFEANGFDLEALARLAAYLPLTDKQREQLVKLAPRGRFADLKLDWRGPRENPTRYEARGRFEGLGLNAFETVPGFSGLSGQLETNEKGGRLDLNGKNATLDLPRIFAESRIDLAHFDARLSWKFDGERLTVELGKINFQNADGHGEIVGRWLGKLGEAGEIDLSARLLDGDGRAVWRYMPLVVNKDARDWLKAGILGGRAPETTLKLKGDLNRFPFKDGSGVFQVKGAIHNATLRYGDGWPQIEHIDGALDFTGPHMTISAKAGKIFGVGLSDVTAEILDLEDPEEILLVSGKARGPTADYLKFIEASPVGERIDHFTEDMTAAGNGDLQLKLTLPLRHMQDSKVDGHYRFDGNRLKVDADLPPLGDVKGELHFTTEGLEARGIRAYLLGMPLTADVKTAEGGLVSINAGGDLSIATLRRELGHPVFEHLSGASKWSGTVRVRKKSAEVKIVSSLQGIASSLPEPFNKTGSEAMELRFERKPYVEVVRAAAKRGAGVKGAVSVATPAAVRDVLEVGLGKNVKALWQRRHEPDRVTVERGLIAIGVPTAVAPERGVLLAANTGRIDADFWRRLLTSSNGNGNGKAAANAASLVPTQLEVRATELTAFGHGLHDLRLGGSIQGANWRIDLASKELTGRLDWTSEGAGRLGGRLTRLVIPELPKGTEAAKERVSELPALDLSVDHFILKDRDLGELKLVAENKDGEWTARIGLRNDDAALSADGRWRAAAEPQQTQVEFKLTAKNVEKTLGRFGYPEAVRRGSADITGSLSWNGAPVGVDYPSLAGHLKAEARNGQFSKLEPGVGRLLGILSLQSLPRRITLDFRDIFSDGFAFDSIEGEFKVAQGVMETQDLRIAGPAAKVFMDGNINLAQETQNLKVRVQPAIGEMVGTGTLLINPGAGLLIWLADKILKDPLGKIFAFQYSVTGSWADPKVEKLAAPPPPSPSEIKPPKEEKAAPMVPAASIAPVTPVVPAPPVGKEEGK